MNTQQQVAADLKQAELQAYSLWVEKAKLAREAEKVERAAKSALRNMLMQKVINRRQAARDALAIKYAGNMFSEESAARENRARLKLTGMYDCKFRFIEEGLDKKGNAKQRDAAALRAIELTNW